MPYRIPYTLRHTRAAGLLSRGVSIPLAAKPLGHSPAMFLNTHAELTREYSIENMDNLIGTCPKSAQASQINRNHMILREIIGVADGS